GAVISSTNHRSTEVRPMARSNAQLERELTAAHLFIERGSGMGGSAVEFCSKNQVTEFLGIETIEMSLRSRLAIRRSIESVIDWAFPIDELTRLANEYGSDKGNRVFGRHYYTRIYHRILAHLRHEPITLLEIGLRHLFDHRVPLAPSLRMWRDYFPAARLIGFDIDDFSGMSLPNCRILQGDMSSREDLSQLFALGPFDIIIDDGSHASAHQQIALAVLFPQVKPGGFYFIEDLHWQPQALERADVPQTRVLLRRKCFDSPVITHEEAQFLAGSVESVQLFNTRDAYNWDKRDALGLLKKIA